MPATPATHATITDARCSAVLRRRKAATLRSMGVGLVTDVDPSAVEQLPPSRIGRSLLFPNNCTRKRTHRFTRPPRRSWPNACESISAYVHRSRVDVATIDELSDL